MIYFRNNNIKLSIKLHETGRAGGRSLSRVTFHGRRRKEDNVPSERQKRTWKHPRRAA